MATRNGSGCPTNQTSLRAVSTTGIPDASIAARAALMRSTAKSNSYSGAALLPLRSSIERPATPVVMQRATFPATPSGSSAKPV